jgi:hypothetical protein
MTFFPTRLQVQWAPSRTFRAANSVVVTFAVVRHRSITARLHRQSDVTNRAYRVSKWPLTNRPGTGRSSMARASSIQFLSGSHSSTDLQSVHARKHSALAVALLLAFVAKYPPPSRCASGTETAVRGVVTTGAVTTMVGYQNASLYKSDHPCRVSLLANVSDRGWSYALGLP